MTCPRSGEAVWVPIRPWSVTQRTVNARQLEVLTWIQEGCPAGVMPDDTYKTTAAALKSRRLVTISKRPWRAEVTDAGRFFLEHGRHPDGHWPEAAPARGRTRRPANAPTTGLRPVDQMLADLTAAGGRLQVAGDRPHWENLVASAVRHRKVPPRKVLKVEGTWSKVVLVLGDAPAWMQTEEPQVQVPQQLRHPHPVIPALRDDSRTLPFSAPTRQRALRLLQALAAAATDRGHQVRAPKQMNSHRRASGHLEIVVRSHAYTLTVSEATTQVEHQLTANEIRGQQQYGAYWAPKYDHVPNGRLRIAINGGWKVHIDKVEDTKTQPAEGKLGTLLLEVELRAAAALATGTRIPTVSSQAAAAANFVSWDSSPIAGRPPRETGTGVNYRGSYKRLRDNASSALLSGIEIYNKPRFAYRDEVVVILTLNAWELLLKAIISKSGGRIFYKKRKGEPYRTLSLSDALTRAQHCSLWSEHLSGLAVSENLSMLQTYRDNAVHYYNSPGFASVIYALMQTAIINFKDLLSSAFGKDLTEEITWHLLPLGVRLPVDPIDFLSPDPPMGAGLRA
jgi:hypothetical protein